MDTVPLKLDGLPIEIIQCIASHGLCEAALTLSHVNRSLYKACSDRQVFKSIIKNRNGHGGPNWDIMPLSDGSPTSSWARYALADSMARRWIAKADANPPWLPVHFPSWAPQLMCSSREFCRTISRDVAEICSQTLYLAPLTPQCYTLLSLKPWEMSSTPRPIMMWKRTPIR